MNTGLTKVGGDVVYLLSIFDNIETDKIKCFYLDIPNQI